MSRQAVNVSPAVKRIMVELAEFQTDLASQTMCHFEPESEDDVLQLKGHIYGPPDTPYHGGVFHLKISVPQNYPFRPPACKMITKVWHPNISFKGYICLDTLRENWAPALSIRALLITIQALLSSVNFQRHYTQTAAFWTYHYAVVNKTEQMITANAQFEAKVSQVMAQKGTDYDKALIALSTNDWNIQSAISNFGRYFRLDSLGT